MRHALALSIALALSACASAPAVGSNPEVANTLLDYAAGDFHEHNGPGPIRFRNVRLGHLQAREAQQSPYLLCGEFQQGGAGAEWHPFETIQTDPYEQWLGNMHCQRPLTWDPQGDLSAKLQERFDALH